MKPFRLLLWLLLPLLGQAQHAALSPAFDTATSESQHFQLMPGLRLSVWAAEPQLSNSVAFSIDGKGRIFLAESDRWAISVFDITTHTNWLLEDMSFHSVADRAAFLTNQFATNLTFLTKDSEVVRVLEDRAGTGHADHSEIIATGFNSVVDGTAAGVLATGTNLYFANIPNLWRLSAGADGSWQIGYGTSAAHSTPNSQLRSPNSDLPSATRERLASGFGVHIGVSGHDLHGLIKGPDGRIYFSFGDRGVCLTNREGAVINLPDCGGVLRCEPDGANLEVFCYGLRNPQELAFDDLGNLWTVDNDTAGADPCRVLHIVEGGDYGWRTSYQHMEGFGPWVQEELWKGGQDGILPPAGTVSQGPCGLAYYPGTGFGTRLAGTFLHCDFPAGVTAFTVKPQGASYVVDRQEKFLWNCWPTDVDFGPDGAVYVLDWVNGWGQSTKGRIYRITPAERDPRQAALVAEVKRLLAEGMTQRGEQELIDLLGHADRRVRLEAQWGICQRFLEGKLTAVTYDGILDQALLSKNRLQRIHAIWTMRQAEREKPGYELCSREPLVALLEDEDPEIRCQAALAVAEVRLQSSLRPLTRLLDDREPRVRWHALQALGILAAGNGLRKEEDSVIQKLAGRLPAQISQRIDDYRNERLWKSVTFGEEEWCRLISDPERTDAFVEQAAGAWVLARFHSTWTAPNFRQGIQHLQAYATNVQPAIRQVALLSMRRLTNSTITNFLTDPDPRLAIAAGRAIHDVPIVEGFPALASFILKIDCPTNLMSRVIDACFRLGTPQHAQMLAGFAKRQDVPDWARVLALRALADWPAPPPLDRVNGLWRPAVNTERGTRSAESTAASPAAPANPVLARAAQAVTGGPASAIPVLPADLGRSATFAEGMAVKRNPAPARRAFLRVAGEIMDPATPDENGVVLGGEPAPVAVQLAVIDTAVRLQTKEASSPLFAEFTRSNTPPEVRRTIVPALAALRAAQAGDAVKLALADPDPALRASALPYLDRLEGADTVGLLVGVVNGPPDRHLAQAAIAAIAALAKLPDAAASTALQNFSSALETGKLPAELALDVHEAIRPRSTEASGFRDALVGGDAARGRQVFYGNQTVQCSRCHRTGGEGGTVGPKLDGIGSRNPREYLLESILAPNAKIAAGFENATVTLRDGRSLTGTVRHEANDALTLELVDGETGTTNSVSLPKTDITQRQRGPSAMPEGLAAQLTPFELRDLVEFLASLK